MAGRQQLAERRRGRRAASAAAVSRTRWFSVSTWRARRRSTGVVDGRARRPVGPAAAGRCAPRPPRTRAAGRRRRSRRACGARPECDHHHLDVVGQRHRLDREVVAVDAAARGPSTPAAEASWSMIPQGTPDARCSARWPSRASARGSAVGAEGEGDGQLERGARGEPGADRQGGGDRARAAPGRARPRRRRRRRSAPRPGAPSGGRDPSSATTAGSRLVVRAQLHPVAAAVAGDRGAEVDRHRQHEPAGGVGVVAHEVDPARRERGDLASHQGHDLAARLTAWSSRARMAAMPTAPPNAAGIELFYETFGEPDGEPLLFVMGLGAQLHVWDDELLAGVRRPGLLRHPLRQPRRRAVDQARRHRRRRGGRGRSCWRVRRAAGRGAVPAGRHGGRRGEPARPPRHRVGAHRRRVDGRDDRPADGHRPPRAGPVGHLDHVDHRRPRRRPARARRAAALLLQPPATSREEAIASSVAAGQGDQQPGALRRGRGPAPGRALLRPLLLPRGRRPASSSPSSRRRRAPRRSARSTVPALVIHGDSDPLVTPSGGAPHRRGDPRRRAARARGHGPRPAAGLLAARSSRPSPSSRPARPRPA